MNRDSDFKACATVKALLKCAAVHLSRAGISTPELDAELLMMHQLGVDRTGLFMVQRDPVSQDVLAGFQALVQRRCGREPLAYITESTGFWDLDLDVKPGVLVPRPDTETLIEAALEVLPAATEKQRRLVDLGTGSGAIALSMASASPGHLVFATDRSPLALDVARSNARKNGLQENLFFVCGLWLSPFSRKAPSFDMVLSNPPYIPTKDIDALEPEVSVFEPRLALDGDEDGLRDYRAIVGECMYHLKPGGWLLFEMGWDQKEAVREILGDSRLFEEISHINDYAGNNRVVRARRKRG